MSKPKVSKNIEVPLEVLKDLLTPSEVHMLRNRWQIIQLVEDGLSIRAIAEQVKVGTDTVVRTIRMMEKNGVKKVVKAKEGLPFKTKTPWIFGKSD